VSDEELQSFANRPVYHTGKTVKCSTIAVEKCALIGDASTAFPPVGQGVNAALEGAAFLGELLVRQLIKSDSPVELESALASYNQQWLPQASACADIANTVVYGSTLSRSKLLLQGALGAVTGVDFAAAQIAKNSKYSYVEAKQKSIRRNALALVSLCLIVAVIITALS
jgi:2-polyprenyl-6-methoxyphenol hydroxylase-like FAD-dependent oxidoreductase